MLFGPADRVLTSGLLWMLSLVSLLSAFQALPKGQHSFFWFALSAILAALAIDEALGVHERSEPYGVNDDYVKIVMWIVVPFVLARVVQLGGNRMVRNAFIAGYVLHTSYLLVEVGDGEPIESALRRFKREVNKSGHLMELRHKRHFENAQEKKKRKIKEGRMRKKFERMQKRRIAQRT